MTQGARSRLSLLLDIVSVGILLVLLALVVRSRVFVDAPPAALNRVIEDSLWEAAWAAARHRGASDASVRILQFSDLECPACRRLAQELHSAGLDTIEDVAIGFLHYPLAQHRFAMRAALVSECAAARGSFWAAYDSLLARQDDFGLLRWSRILGDTVDEQGLDECVSSAKGSRLIESHRSLGRRIGIPGTPAVMINGLLLAAPPTAVTLDSIVAAARGTQP
ncbi:MAG TPA: thioredoxin domain-containing protein [Gemmatimonadaceae bacterium]|nr:thioredoxin domain-containing protein [Gemmatimonadaceae bacterium]